MALPDAKQITVADTHYACTNCGRCCRHLYVHIPEAEKHRLQALAWKPDDAIPQTITTRIAGHDYLAHTANDACIFLDQASNLCRIHGRFGAEAKPLGCRVYPYNIVSTFPGRLSVMGRYDCPAVRANQGPPLRQDLPAMRQYMSQMSFQPGFDAGTLDNLQERTVATILESLFNELLNRRALPVAEQLAGAIMALERLEKLGAPFLNSPDPGLRQLIPSFFERVRSDVAALRARRLGRIEAGRFLSLLGAYLRRDEEMIGRSQVARLRRTAALATMLVGRVNSRDLGGEHPNCTLDTRLLFTHPLDAQQVDWRPFLDLVRVRLQTHQFMGPANYNLSFFIGARSLLLTFPLVVAAAKWSALARAPGAATLSAADLDYAIGAIDHSFGRSALLKVGLNTVMARQMTESAAYHRLVWNLWHGTRV